MPRIKTCFLIIGNVPLGFICVFIYQVDIDRAVAAARDAVSIGSKWRDMDASARAIIMYKFAELIERDVQYLAVSISEYRYSVER